MLKSENRSVLVTYCDYCDGEITDATYRTIRGKGGPMADRHYHHRRDGDLPSCFERSEMIVTKHINSVELKKRLEGLVDDALTHDEALDEASWRDQIGIVITVRQALLFIELLKKVNR